MENVIEITAAYPGGNIKVGSVEPSAIYVEQELRDTTEWWFYWNFHIRFAKTEEVTIRFSNGEVIGPWGPAMSLDGIHWSWLGKESLIDREAFRYKPNKPNESVYFAFCIPYLLDDFLRFYERYGSHPLVVQKELTRSEAGRSIPLLMIGNQNASKDILFTCRHHACEATGSYVLEGVLSYLLDKSSSVLDNYLISVIPFIDLDGVEEGDQGKARKPHDHNRDYTDTPLYRSIQALTDYAMNLNLIVGLDFHAPYKWGDRNDYPFFVKQRFPIKEEIEKLGLHLQQITLANSKPGRIVYDPRYDIEKGQEWNVDNPTTSSAFFIRHSARLAATLEFPYFGSEGQIMTQTTMRDFGKDLGRALEIYLEEAQ